MKQTLMAAAIAGAFMATAANAETQTTNMQVTGALIEACNLTGGSVNFDLDADPSQGSATQPFSITVQCDRPYRVTWSDGGSEGRDDLSNYGTAQGGGTLDGYLFLTDADGSAITATDGVVGRGENNADNLAFNAIIARDESGQKGIYQAGSLAGTITLQVTY